MDSPLDQRQAPSGHPAPLEVPALTFEDHHWVAEADGMTSRSKMAQASGEYRSAVTPSIAPWSPSLPGDLAADVEEAATALARFDMHAAMVLGPGSPSLGPMSSILLRTESASSSQIENLTVGARQLALAEIDQPASDNAKTVVANVRAMEAALNLADRLDQDAILTMHRQLLTGQRGWEDHAGRYRDQLVWIGTSTVTPRGAAHVAPQAELVPTAMSDLVSFLERDDLPALVQAAIAHAQFETIHPFADGNGRTGRSLMHAVLRAKGVVTCTTAPVSAGLLKDTGRYFAALDAYRLGDGRPIVEQVTDAARFAASSGARLVDALGEQIDISREKIAHLRPSSSAHKVLPHLIAHPVVNVRLLSGPLGLSEASAHRALAALTNAGVIEERTGLQRNRVWQHTGVLAVLDAYAEGLHRR